MKTATKQRGEMGIFCLGHFSTDVEKIREYRQKNANKKAAKYDLAFVTR